MSTIQNTVTSPPAKEAAAPTDAASNINSSEVEEILARIGSHKGVEGILVMTKQGTYACMLLAFLEHCFVFLRCKSIRATSFLALVSHFLNIFERIWRVLSVPSTTRNYYAFKKSTDIFSRTIQRVKQIICYNANLILET